MMLPGKRLLCAAGLLMLMAGCSTPSVQELSQMQPSGSEFNQTLAKEYASLAQFETEMVDPLDADWFAQKGIKAANNEATLPDVVWSRDIPPEHVARLEDARSRLMQAYDHDVKTRYPMESAVAQASYDCWLEQQEENFQPAHIATCRRTFAQSMRTIYAKEQARLADVSRAAERVSGPEKMIFFEFGEATIASGDLEKLDRIAEQVGKNGGTPKITVIGHTDRAGPDAYNKQLSVRRAESVKQALKERGVSAEVIAIEGRGETDLLVETPDGVAEAKNRRVQISVS